MLVFVAASAVAFIGVALFVGTRLLLLARRTRGVPELLLALTVLMIGGIGYPAAMLSGYGVKPVGEMWMPAYVVSIVANVIGSGCAGFFTWRVFRAGERWALGFAMLLLGITGVSQAGILHAMLRAPAALDSHLAGGGWFTLGLVAGVATFGWTGVEAGRYYRVSLRRQALGLADPLVTNRFLLWCLAGAGSCLGTVMNLVSHLEGRPVFEFTPVMVLTGLIGFGTSLSLLLTFSPPPRYAAWIRARAGAAAAEAG